MERRTYHRGKYLCHKNDKAENLFLIQDGVVEVQTNYTRKGNLCFTIERLGRGAVINPRSFMMRDDASTDFVCSTTVSVFVLSH